MLKLGMLLRQITNKKTKNKTNTKSVIQMKCEYPKNLFQNIQYYNSIYIYNNTGHVMLHFYCQMLHLPQRPAEANQTKLIS